ncbi:glycoside hydrolase family 72 protein, partial [Conidiobolus coronatus NRRL 28638]
PLLINGTRFVTPSDLKPFFFKGVVIQHMFVDDVDPLAKSNLEKCKTTAKKLKDMGANTALVYRIDPNENHKDCMQEFKDNNIQVLIGLSPESNQYNSTYSPQILQNITRTIDEFILYPNTLGYMVWIENNQSFGDKFSHELQYVIKKSVIRDIRTYIRKKYQPIILPLLGANMVYYKDDINKVKDYLMCGERVSQPDFLTISTFSHCGELSTNDIDALIPRDLTFPMIFSELGCSAPKRNFEAWKQMVKDDKLSEALSGGFAYELYGTDSNDYGLISKTGSPPNSTFADNLTKTWESIHPTLSIKKVERANYTCPTNFPIEITDSTKDGLMRPPSLDVCNCVVSHSPCISTLDDPEKLSKQLTSLCNNDSSKCDQYLGPITGNFSQCSMMTRISFLVSLNYNK